MNNDFSLTLIKNEIKYIKKMLRSKEATLTSILFLKGQLKVVEQKYKTMLKSKGQKKRTSV